MSDIDVLCPGSAGCSELSGDLSLLTPQVNSVTTVWIFAILPWGVPSRSVRVPLVMYMCGSDEMTICVARFHNPDSLPTGTQLCTTRACAQPLAGGLARRGDRFQLQ